MSNTNPLEFRVQSDPQTVQAWADAHPEWAESLDAALPTDQALNRLGLDFLKRGGIPESVSIFRFAVTQFPANPTLWTHCGMALERAGLLSDAIAAFEQSLKLSWNQPDTWLLLGSAQQRGGDRESAGKSFQVALELAPKSRQAWQLLALLKQEQGDFAGAAEALTSGIRSGGASAVMLGNLGKLHYQLGRFAEADDAYQLAARFDARHQLYRPMLRQTGFLRAVLAGEDLAEAVRNYQDNLPPGETSNQDGLKAFLNRAVSLLSGFGHLEAAAQVGRKSLELWPEDASTRYLLQSIAGDPGLACSSPEYVLEHFDQFAAGFEGQLVGALGYDVPEQIGAALSGLIRPGKLYDTLDAGCGTGLCGPRLRPWSRTLTGVDLSPKMLEQAAGKKLYDTLVCQELGAYLAGNGEAFDLVVAADVMIYFGDLQALFAALARALKPGGLLAFSIESGAEAGWKLRPSGRFVHSPDYVRDIARAGFEEMACAETTLRLEANRRMPGRIFVFRRR